MLKIIAKTSALALLSLSVLGTNAVNAQGSILDSIANPPLIHKAERALLKGHNQYVVKLLADRSFSKARDSAYAHSLLCQAEYQLGHDEAAIANCTKALGEAKPTWVDYHVRAGANYRLGQYSAALRDFEAAAKLAPNQSHVQRNLEIARMAIEEPQVAQNQ